METPPENGLHLPGASSRVARRLLVIFENRLELLSVEVQEERERLLCALWLVMGAAAFGLLAGIALSALVVIVCWEHSPVAALLILTALYAAAAVFIYRRLSRLHRDWETFSATLDQLRKDRQCLEKKFN